MPLWMQRRTIFMRPLYLRPNFFRQSYYYRPAPAILHRSFVRVIPRLIGNVARLPSFALAVGAGSLAYIDQKLKKASDYSRGLFQYTKEWVGSTSDKLKDKATSASSTVKDKTSSIINALKSWTDQQAQKVEKFRDSRRSDQGSDPGKNKGPGLGSAAAAAAAATAGAMTKTVSSDSMDNEETGSPDAMMVLTRKMIEIRNLLSQISTSDQFVSLPSIVVIGSQSSGKSSVLEAIVGQDFLPKGTNMVTRRPIELTLVNSPDVSVPYGEIDGHRYTDFAKIHKVLTDMNLNVPPEQCVSPNPIQLRVCSKYVPDLTLIDLPGYIQIHNKDQPSTLREKINDLCESYISQPSNIILAICAADVDLANSPALRASRRVDPLGLRTIGVVTKIDLVEPNRAREILLQNSIPLNHGYFGVITKVEPIRKYSQPRKNLSLVVDQHEKSVFSSFFQGEKSDFLKCLGTMQLKNKLMHVLEQTMAQNLQSTENSIRRELDETSYKFKVEFNDRELTPEIYIAESMDDLKHSFKDFSSTFGKSELKKLVKSALNDELLNIVAEKYWLNSKIQELEASKIKNLPEDEIIYWNRLLELVTSQITKCGIGRLSTQLLTNKLISHVESMIETGPLATHPYAKDKISNAARELLRRRFLSTSDQVENCIKPFKYEVEVDEADWKMSYSQTQKLLDSEAEVCSKAFQQLAQEVGSRRLQQVLAYISNKDDEDLVESIGFSSGLIEIGKQARFLQERQNILGQRKRSLKSRTCQNIANKMLCPEMFFNVVTEKLATTAVLFLNVELLSEFFFEFPREVDKLLLHGMSPEDCERFAKEDPRIRSHLELQKKKELLEQALSKINSLMQLERHQLEEKNDSSSSFRPVAVRS